MRRMIPNTQYVFDWDPVLQAYTNSNVNVPILPEGIYLVSWDNISDVVKNNVVINTHLDSHGYKDFYSGLITIANDPNEDWISAMVHISEATNGGGIKTTVIDFTDETFTQVKNFAYADVEIILTRIA